MDAKRSNCWQVMKCGREPGGSGVPMRGVCPAAIEERLTGINGGVCGGRACWGVVGTECISSLTAKFTHCLECPFYRLVEHEEGSGFDVMSGIAERLAYRERDWSGST